MMMIKNFFKKIKQFFKPKKPIKKVSKVKTQITFLGQTVSTEMKKNGTIHLKY